MFTSFIVLYFWSSWFMGCLCMRPQAIGWPIIYEHNCVELETELGHGHGCGCGWGYSPVSWLVTLSIRLVGFLFCNLLSCYCCCCCCCFAHCVARCATDANRHQLWPFYRWPKKGQRANGPTGRTSPHSICEEAFKFD